VGLGDFNPPRPDKPSNPPIGGGIKPTYGLDKFWPKLGGGGGIVEGLLLLPIIGVVGGG